MRGLAGAKRLALESQLRYAGPCVFPGQLFDLGAYPGLRHGPGRVVGELHALLDVAAIATLDEFEGYDRTQPRSSLYLRERVELLEPKATMAWVYVYNAAPDASTRVVDGDWRAHLDARSAS
jgi:gamma-glutamylcyclotransferase (GGCT)/AIG2-like uncharacterized protein YtfP